MKERQSLLEKNILYSDANQKKPAWIIFGFSNCFRQMMALLCFRMKGILLPLIPHIWSADSRNLVSPIRTDWQYDVELALLAELLALLSAALLEVGRLARPAQPELQFVV